MALRFDLGKVCGLHQCFASTLELLPNFYNENLIAFRLVFMTEIRQHFKSGSSWHAQRDPHQAFAVKKKATLLSWQKSSRVSHLVHHDVLAGFHAY